MKLNKFSTMRVLAIALSFLFTSVAFANNGSNGTEPGDGKKITETAKIAYSIYPIINTNKIRVAYEKYGDVAVSIRIYDDNMNLLYSDTQKEATYLKRNYDLGKIGSGEYVVRIQAGDYTTVHRVDVGQKEEQKFSAYLSPQLTNNKVRIAFQHATSPVFVAIYDQDGKLVYEKTMKEQNFSSIFNLSPLDKGKYTIMVSSNGDTTESTYQL